MKNNHVIIIGAGIAGLAAGYYLQKSGFFTEIFEGHSIPGGLCTSWKRKGYTIDGCIHGLLGSEESHPYYQLWSELADIEDVDFTDFDTVYHFRLKDGTDFPMYSDLSILRQYLTEISPQDKHLIDKYLDDVKKIQKIRVPFGKAKELYGPLDYIKLIKVLPALKIFSKWSKVSATEFAKRFTSPILREAFSTLISPVLFEMFVLSEMDLKRCGYPCIGSQGLVTRIANKYTSSGGVIHFKNKVSKILVEKNSDSNSSHAYGVLLADGSTSEADVIISAADGRETLFNMLDLNHINTTYAKKMQKTYDNNPINASRIQIAVGLLKNLSGFSHTNRLILENPLNLPDGSIHTFIDVRIFNFATKFTTPYTTVMIVQLPTKTYEYWSELRENDHMEYKRIKREIADVVIDIINSRLINISHNVDMVDVSTPKTYERYTNNWKGSIQGWESNKLIPDIKIKKTIPRLKSFYMIGQWVHPGGGVPTSALTGRDVAQVICKLSKIPFSS